MIKIVIVLIALAGRAYTFQTGSVAIGGARVSTRGIQSWTHVPHLIASQRLCTSPRSNHILLMSGSGEKATGPEKKYVYAAGVVMFAILWDFFITHGGQPYLAHPQ